MKYDTCEELFDACGAQCSNFEAEAEAIKASLDSSDHISQAFRQKTKPQTNVIIFSDAKSVSQALESGKLDNTSIKNLTKRLDTL